MAEESEYSTGNESGMLICSSGNKWESFGGMSSETIAGVKSEFISGWEIASKAAGSSEFIFGETVEYSRFLKYEFIDVQGFMFDNEGLQYFGGTHNVTTSEGFFSTAGLNEAGLAMYEACVDIVGDVGDALLLQHSMVAAAGISMTTATSTDPNVEEDALKSSTSDGLAVATNIPIIAEVIASIVELIYVAYGIAAKFKELQDVTGVKPLSFVYGTPGRLFTGSIAPDETSYTQITQNLGVITLGASPGPATFAVQKLNAIPSQPEQRDQQGNITQARVIGVPGITFAEYVAPPLAAQIVINGLTNPSTIAITAPDGGVSTEAATVGTTATTTVSVEAPEVVTTASTSFTVTIDDNTSIVLSPSSIEIKTGAASFLMTPDNIEVGMGNTMLNLTADSASLFAGGCSLEMVGGTIDLSASTINLDADAILSNGDSLAVTG